MKRVLTALALLVFASSTVASAHPPAKKWSAAALADGVATAFAGGDWSALDTARAYAGKIRVVIENSLSDDNDPDRFVTRSFSSFAAFETWLKSREHDGMPARNVSTMTGCAKGTCSFEKDGLLHNHIYLRKVTYGMRGGSAYVKTIYILDGD
ncbi:MAG: hypothetical protein ABIP75_05655 [Pyrinomonadaceae bacterium]